MTVYIYRILVFFLFFGVINQSLFSKSKIFYDVILAEKRIMRNKYYMNARLYRYTIANL